MENQNEFLTNEQPKSYTLKFFGKGSDYFGIIIVNWLLTLITFGIYYPWARARKIKYMYGATALNDDRFAFHGTGKEMFRGFVKVIIFYIVLVGILFAAQYYVTAKHNFTIYFVLLLLYFVLFFAIIPLIYHGAYRYRMSRTTWRGIRFGYRGSRKQLYINFLKWLGLTAVTFGIYSAWFEINLRKYLLGNVRAGDVKFSYKGEGVDLFIINLKLAGMVLLGFFPAVIVGVIVAISSGYEEMNNFMPVIMLAAYLPALIYLFWYEKNIWNYYIDNIELEKDEQTIQMKSTVTGGGLFKLRTVNLLMTIFSLGLAYAWVEVRTRKYFTENTHLKGDIDLDKIIQTEEIYTDAMFEDAGDFFDIDIF